MIESALHLSWSPCLSRKELSSHEVVKLRIRWISNVENSSTQATRYDFLNSCLRFSEVLVVDEHLGSSCVWASSGKPSAGTHQLNTYINETFTAGATKHETVLSPQHNCSTLVADLFNHSNQLFVSAKVHIRHVPWQGHPWCCPAWVVVWQAVQTWETQENQTRVTNLFMKRGPQQWHEHSSYRVTNLGNPSLTSSG